MSSRSKRKLISDPSYESSIPDNMNEEQSERQNMKRVRKAVKRDNPSAADAEAPPSKGTHTKRLHIS